MIAIVSGALSHTPQKLHRGVPLQVVPHAWHRTPKGTTDPGRSPDEYISARVDQCQRWSHTLFASLRASSHFPAEARALLRLVKRFVEVTGRRNSTAVYRSMASWYFCAAAAVSAVERRIFTDDQMMEQQRRVIDDLYRSALLASARIVDWFRDRSSTSWQPEDH